MKKHSGILLMSLLIMAFLVTGNDAMAQRRQDRSRSDREMREAADQEKQKGKEQVKDAREDMEEQGNAYGRKKGDLQGREFGQARAEEARMQHMEKQQHLDAQLQQGEAKVVRARERIRVEREALENERAARKISDKEYQQKKEKLDNAEKAVQELDRKLREGKSLKEQ